MATTPERAGVPRPARDTRSQTPRRSETETPRRREAETPRDGLAAHILRVVGTLPVHILLVVIAVLWLMPTLGLFFTSLLLPSDIASGGWWQVFTEPSRMTLDNYAKVLDDPAITSALLTTLWIAIGSTVLPIFIAALAGYAFAWMDFPGRDWLFIGVIAMLVVPLQMALIPMFSLYNRLGIFDTVAGLILFHTAFGLPFAIFLLRNFFIGIPKELLEAARIDGASELGIFFRLVLPLGLPAIASVGIFQFLWIWNELLVALTLGRETQPITVAIFSQMRQFGANIDVIAPAAFLSLVVPLIVFFAFQRYFVQGLLAGSVK
jgi:alpha-glucoside transport system permease protein